MKQTTPHLDRTASADKPRAKAPLYPKIKRWYVTSSHRTLRRTAGLATEVPYGTGHVRLVGSTETACGQPAALWPIFWDLAVEAVEDFCPECRWTARLDATAGVG